MKRELAGLRKWSVVMVSLVFAFILALLDKLTGDYVTLVGIAVAAFHMGNAYEAKQATLQMSVGKGTGA